MPLYNALIFLEFLKQQTTKIIDSTIVDINLSEVTSNSGEPGGLLGSYAGKGVGAKRGRNSVYESDTFGQYITICCVVPDTNYSQGVDYNIFHCSPTTFPRPDFDSLGFQTSMKNVVTTNSEYLNKAPVTKQPFGYVPRFFECKTKLNRLNGELTLPSTRNSFLPYTLDRFITPNYMEVKSTGTGTYQFVSAHSALS